MGSSNLNFKNFGNEPPNNGGNNARPPGNNIPLTRQSSVYSLTFDEFQSAVGGGSGKDLGSMNMDELLKNIWTAEENQNLGSTSGLNQEGGNLLQKQGSLTLPRTLSQKTVEEVWRDMAKEYGIGNDDTMGGASNFGVPQRQPTLGEVTLEEFLVRAGVVREDAQMAVKANNLGFFGDLPNSTLDSLGLGYGFQQHQEEEIKTTGLMGNRVLENTNQVPTRMSNPSMNVNMQKQQILPKQPGLAFGAPIGIPSNNSQLPNNNSPHVQNIGISDPATNNSTRVQNAALQGMSGLGQNGIAIVTTGSPVVSSDGLAKNNNGDTSLVSPIPYLLNGGIRGRKSAALEKVIERRQRRMIKNRESAARSRAPSYLPKAYTMELEAEIAKLKEENEELRKKQAEIMEMQKNQALELMNQQNGAKRQCLRRTQTGPW